MNGPRQPPDLHSRARRLLPAAGRAHGRPGHRSRPRRDGNPQPLGPAAWASQSEQREDRLLKEPHPAHDRRQPGSDRTLLDNLLSDAIARTYKRCAIRYSNPIPTFNDLREELANWRDEERLERTIDEAKLAAIKLRLWTGEKGIYSKLFDSPTTMRLCSNWLFFNIEGLKSDPTLETAMSMVIANAVADRASGRTGQPSITVLDECWALLDSPTLAPEVVQLFRTARNRYGSV